MDVTYIVLPLDNQHLSYHHERRLSKHALIGCRMDHHPEMELIKAPRYTRIWLKQAHATRPASRRFGRAFSCTILHAHHRLRAGRFFAAESTLTPCQIVSIRSDRQRRCYSATDRHRSPWKGECWSMAVRCRAIDNRKCCYRTQSVLGCRKIDRQNPRRIRADS